MIKLSVVSDNFENITKGYTKMIHRNEEMSLELIGLINTKTQLLTEKEMLSQEIEKLKSFKDVL